MRSPKYLYYVFTAFIISCAALLLFLQPLMNVHGNTTTVSTAATETPSTESTVAPTETPTETAAVSKKKEKKKKHKKKYNQIKSIQLSEKKVRLNVKNHRYLKVRIAYKSKKQKNNEKIIWTSQNKNIATVSQAGVVTGKKKGSTYITVKSEFSGIQAKCKVTVGKTKYIAITFDDGPGIYTNQLLNALENYDSKATFLLVGANVSSYSKQVKREHSLFMQIGNHSWSHANLKAISKKQVSSQINRSKNAIKQMTGENPSIFRPPYGNYNSTVASAVDVPMIYWSVDTLDWKYRNNKYVCSTILKYANDGEVVLLHDIHKTSVEGFIKALPTLIKRHYELVTVSELFQIHGKKMKKGVMYFSAK